MPNQAHNCTVWLMQYSYAVDYYFMNYTMYFFSVILPRKVQYWVVKALFVVNKALLGWKACFMTFKTHLSLWSRPCKESSIRGFKLARKAASLFHKPDGEKHLTTLASAFLLILLLLLFEWTIQAWLIGQRYLTMFMSSFYPILAVMTPGSTVTL